MPPGIPVATMAINGARNASLLAVRMLAASDEVLQARVRVWQKDLAGKLR
jgi:5-(carboxyamino)imidazole ribonucleotide mutase